ncbi:hypothetical protein MMC07_001003 [Pseudocyphellaria aurata]|nr:hypothetical protein [Pseudocyphellaria aurata]
MSTRVTRGSVASAALFQPLANTGRKRKRTTAPKVEEDPNELPHNLGRITVASDPKKVINTSEVAKPAEEAKAPDEPDGVPAPKSRPRAAKTTEEGKIPDEVKIPNEPDGVPATKNRRRAAIKTEEAKSPDEPDGVPATKRRRRATIKTEEAKAPDKPDSVPAAKSRRRAAIKTEEAKVPDEPDGLPAAKSRQRAAIKTEDAKIPDEVKIPNEPDGVPATKSRRRAAIKTEEAKAPDEPDGVPATKGRRRAANPYGLTPGVTPFPDWPHPTIAECREVNQLLSTVHGVQAAPTEIPKPSLTVSGCGEVPSILDAMIRTRLSAATAGSNSNLAIEGLVKRFGILQDGIGKGSIDWDAVRRADVKDVFEAIKAGGLGEVKSADIKAILEMVHSENQSRCEALIKAERVDADAAPKGAENETPAEKNAEIVRAKENVLSLDHLHALGDNDAMNALVKYPGIGVKTASCVMLFCMRRPSFAVDTHVFRLLKWLKWVPPEVKGEIAAFKHIEYKVPNELKYSLHQLFIKHGRTCGRCRAATGETSVDWDKGCVIDHLVTRTGSRKGGVDASPGKKALAKPTDGKNAAEKPKSVTVKKEASKIQTGKKVVLKRGEKMKQVRRSAEDQGDLSALSEPDDDDDDGSTERKKRKDKVAGKKVDAKKPAATTGMRKKKADSSADHQNDLSVLPDAPDEEDDDRLTETKRRKINIAEAKVDAKKRGGRKVATTRSVRKNQANSSADGQNARSALSNAPDETDDGQLTDEKRKKTEVAAKKATVKPGRGGSLISSAVEDDDLSELSDLPDIEDDLSELSDLPDKEEDD